MDVTNNRNDFLKDVEESLITLAKHVPKNDDSIDYLLRVSEIMKSYDHFTCGQDDKSAEKISLAIQEMVDRATT